jgi:hypothetical protein
MPRARDHPLIQTWQSWLARIGVDVRNLYQSRRMFDEVTKRFQQYDADLVRGPLWIWMAGNWAWSMAMGVRRLTDLDHDVISMVRLLEEIEHHSDVVTRDWFITRWIEANAPSILDIKTGVAFFDLYAPGGAPHVLPEKIRRDRDCLQCDANRVRTVVNRRFAHYSVKQAPDDVTLGEVGHALDMIGERYRVYERLLNQQVKVDLGTPLPSDWDRPLR